MTEGSNQEDSQTAISCGSNEVHNDERKSKRFTNS